MDEIVHQANDQLRGEGCRIRLYQRKAGLGLQLQGTFPPKPGSGKVKPHQQKLSLRMITGLEVQPSPQGVKRAIAEAKRVDTLLMLNQFDWQDFMVRSVKVREGPLGREVVSQFKDWYFGTRGRTEQTHTTWKTEYEQVFKVLDPTMPLSQEEVEAFVLAGSEPNTRTRKRFVMAMRKLCEFAEVPINVRRFRELAGSYQPGETPRQLLSDEEVEKIWGQIDSPHVKLWWGYLATFGLRNHELFHLDASELLKGGRTIEVSERAKSKARRVVYPLPSRWIERFELRQVLGLEPEAGVLNRTLGARITKAFQRHHLPEPYTLRHCWKERAIRLGIDPAIAARSLGHSPMVSQKHYTRWMGEQSVAEVFSQL